MADETELVEAGVNFEITPAMLKAGGKEVSLWLFRCELEVGPYTAQIIARAAFRAMMVEARAALSGEAS